MVFSIGMVFSAYIGMNIGFALVLDLIYNRDDTEIYDTPSPFSLH